MNGARWALIGQGQTQFNSERNTSHLFRLYLKLIFFSTQKKNSY